MNLKSRLSNIENYLESLKPVRAVKVIVNPDKPTATLRRYCDGKAMLINVGVKDYSS